MALGLPNGEECQRNQIQLATNYTLNLSVPTKGYNNITPQWVFLPQHAC